MHQEKQESQDGRIIMYPDYNIRVSSQPNVYGEKFVLRLLKKNAGIKKIYDLGFPKDEELVRKCFNTVEPKEPVPPVITNILFLNASVIFCISVHPPLSVRCSQQFFQHRTSFSLFSSSSSTKSTNSPPREL